MIRKKNKFQSPLFRTACYLLALTLLFTGLTFARFVSVTNPDPKVDVGSFSCDIVVDKTEGSSFIFNNANYEHVSIIMNSPQVTSFHVTNTVEGKTAGVDIKYSLVLYVPQTFAKSVAVQILNSEGNAVTPLYVLNQFLGTTGFTTKSGYGEVGSLDQTFAYENDQFVATSGLAGSVLVEETSFESTVVRSYPCLSGVNMLAHLYLTNKETVPYYKFTVSNANFATLVGGTIDTDEYRIQLVPTVGMSDTVNEKFLDEDFKTDRYGTPAPGKAWQNFCNDATVISSATDWTATKNGDTLDMSYTVGGVTTFYTNVEVRACDGKTYPCRLNAVFEQASTGKAGS